MVRFRYWNSLVTTSSLFLRRSCATSQVKVRLSCPFLEEFHSGVRIQSGCDWLKYLEFSQYESAKGKPSSLSILVRRIVYFQLRFPSSKPVITFIISGRASSVVSHLNYTPGSSVTYTKVNYPSGRH